MTRDRADTPRTCPLCGGAERSDGCRICGGRGVVDAATAARWASSRRARSTSTSVITADVVAALVDELARCPDAASAELERRGRELLSEIAKWKLDPVDGPTRPPLYERAGTWQAEASKHLAAKKGA